MAQYEAGQYINEFMNEMPSLLLTMRKMDIDQMLDTRRLDQQDTVNNMQQQRDLVDANMRERQMVMNEDIFGESKQGREAWRKVKGPLLKNMKQRMQLDEEYREQRKDMGFWDELSRPGEEDINIPFTDYSIRDSERTLAKEAAEDKYGKPQEASEVFGDIESMSADLNPEQFLSIYQNPVFQSQLLGKTGLLGATTAGSVGGYYP
jgi:hypothetical protein|tara:strand:+ start:293 stop:910 length:618 start_codon:yes stop_codon:yes gene_type:complete